MENHQKFRRPGPRRRLVMGPRRAVQCRRPHQKPAMREQPLRNKVSMKRKRKKARRVEFVEIYILVRGGLCTAEVAEVSDSCLRAPPCLTRSLQCICTPVSYTLEALGRDRRQWRPSCARGLFPYDPSRHHPRRHPPFPSPRQPSAPPPLHSQNAHNLHDQPSHAASPRASTQPTSQPATPPP